MSVSCVLVLGILEAGVAAVEGPEGVDEIESEGC
jgi:hypothetical protein